jgi:mannose-6-phosphate isomerase-like protein (cupin superfamily)
MRLRSWNQVSRPVPGTGSHFCGLWEFQLHGGEQTPSHQQASEEVIVALEGEGNVLLAGQTVLLKPGEVVWVPAQAAHSIGNPTQSVLRGLSMEIGDRSAPSRAGAEAARVSERDLESLIESIPSQVDEATSLQLIIQLFDTAGVLSEQIENAIGLDSETGLNALHQIERRVMEAVVEISRIYSEGDNLFFPRRF